MIFLSKSIVLELKGSYLLFQLLNSRFMHHNYTIIGPIGLEVLLKLVQLVCLLLQVLLEHTFFLSNHGKLPLEVLRIVLTFMDFKLKF